MSKSKIHLPIKFKTFPRIKQGKIEIVDGTFHYKPEEGKIIVKDNNGEEKEFDYKLQTIFYSIAEQPRPETHNYFTEFTAKYIGSILKFQYITKEARKLNTDELFKVAQDFLEKVIKLNRLETTFEQLKIFINKYIQDKYKQYVENEIKTILEKDIEDSIKQFKSFINNPENYIAKRIVNTRISDSLGHTKTRKDTLYGSVRSRNHGEGYSFFRDEGRVKSNHSFILNLVETLKYLHNQDMIDNFTQKLVPYLYKFDTKISLDKKQFKESLAEVLLKNPDNPVVFINLPKTVYKVGEKDFTDYLVLGFAKHLRKYDRKERGFVNRKHIAITSEEYSDGKAFESKAMSKFERKENIQKIFGKWKEMEELGLIRPDHLKAKIPKDAIVILIDDIITTGASVQSFVNYLGNILGRENNEKIYSVVLHNNNYKKQIEDELKRKYGKEKSQ